MLLTVRPAESSDAGRLASLHVATWRETYAHLLARDFFDDEHSRMRERMWTHILGHPRDEWTVRVAEIDGRACGFAMSGPSVGSQGDEPPRDRQLFSLYVSEADHGTGVGQALLEETLGTGPAMLWVAKQNPRAVSFYRRNGFALDGAEQIDPGGPGITDARMVR